MKCQRALRAKFFGGSYVFYVLYVPIPLTSPKCLTCPKFQNVGCALRAKNFRVPYAPCAPKSLVYPTCPAYPMCQNFLRPLRPLGVQNSGITKRKNSNIYQYSVQLRILNLKRVLISRGVIH